MPISEYPTIRDFSFVGDNNNPLVGSAIASATTIAPNRGIHHVTGVATIQTVTIPWDGFSGSCFLIADGAWSFGTSGNINSALTVASGDVVILTYDPAVDKWFPLISGSGGVAVVPGGVDTNVQFNDAGAFGGDAALVFQKTGSGDGAIVFRKTQPSAVGDNQATPFLGVFGTLTRTSGSVVLGAKIGINSLVSSAAVANFGLNASLEPGYTGVSVTTAIRGANGTSGTGTVLNGIDSTTNGPNIGVLGRSTATTIGSNVGVAGRTLGGLLNVALYGESVTDKNSGINVGLITQAFNAGTSPTQVGAYINLNPGGSNPTLTSAALIVDNGAQTDPIFSAWDGAVPVFTIGDGGNYIYDRTITPAATTGSQVINKAIGTVNFAAAATVITVTNSLVNASSIIFVTPRRVDSAATVFIATPGAGSFTITANAAVNTETSVGFLVTN